MFLQETFVVYDTFIYDNGTTASHNDNAWDGNNLPTVVRGNDGTTVTNEATGNRYLYANKGTTGIYDWDTPLCIEFNFEKLNTDNINPQIQLFDEQNNYFANWSYSTGHYKITIKNDEVSWTINGNAQTGKTVTLGAFFIRFYTPVGASFKFSNFKVYPI